MPNILGLAAISLTDDAAAGFASVPTGTTQAILKCESNSVRLGDATSVPTASTGYLWSVGETLAFVGNDYGDFLRNLNIINATAGSNGVIKGIFFNGFDRA